MEQSKEKTKNLNLFTSHDLLIAMDLKENDEILILDSKFKIKCLFTTNCATDVKLFLLNSDNEITNISISLTSLIGIPFEKLN